MSTFGSKKMWIRVAVIEVLMVIAAGSVYFFFGPKQMGKGESFADSGFIG